MSRTFPTLDDVALISALTAPRGPFRRADVVAETGSTNVDLAAAAVADPAAWPDLSVLAANSQVAGKGRLDRTWEVPAGAAMISSVLFRPSDAAAHPGAPAFDPAGHAWLSVVAGIALCQAVAAETGASAVLKWPNDVLLNGRKLAGILAQLVAPGAGRAGAAVVVGVGVNISQQRAELPVETATSLELETGAVVDRNVLLPAYLVRLAGLYRGLVAVGGDVLRPLAGGESIHAMASALMSTLGTDVRAELPGGRMLYGTAVGIGAAGELQLRDAGGVLHAVSAGDVVHLRRTGHDGGVGYA
ncbi:biotin--[acetyl-CoA-carboxylase] ligase [Arthrobacter sp. STN4]|uniref:biotin--[acetyl-CoA-carboxylase] ligase n=1 Tax=Arthrobacter sp. STN4 TaxID=2923276 RepID=UPI00211A87BB|nr:biotin--[acetyl-CoA-carboxylase] ligase [Arthrobacter sp. STN4]MCQ9163396.1 biotin--[acetyl-CoA-carboxylase] ligase [Arthrobacter sp. STN4]